MGRYRQSYFTRYDRKLLYKYSPSLQWSHDARSLNSNFMPIQFANCCVFWPPFGCCTHPKAGQTTFSAVFNLFCWFQPWTHWKRFLNEQKRWKTAEKSSLNSFWVRTAPKSWLKYTTDSQANQIYQPILTNNLVDKTLNISTKVIAIVKSPNTFSEVILNCL